MKDAAPKSGIKKTTVHKFKSAGLIIDKQACGLDFTRLKAQRNVTHRPASAITSCADLNKCSFVFYLSSFLIQIIQIIIGRA